MAKKRKTRAQKQLADFRHIFTHGYSPVTPASVKLTKSYTNKTEVKTFSTTQASYPFLKRDLSKTAILTLGILVFQILLFLSLRHHFFTIPGLTY